ncbi:MAG: DUF4184 family protein [Deltaproteobacteria bacterium]|nr:MAG: DUF4184 family protein [Deltaproteobacteria bacterium]
MPFTPFHFGPGLFVKSISKKRFSLSVFILSQVFIDVETLVNILLKHERWHTFFHTFIGTTCALVIVSLLSKILSNFVGDIFGIFKDVTWSQIIISAFIGVYSHVFLDAMMHSDLRPFSPFSFSNPFLHLVSLKNLHEFCVVSGSVGIVIFISKKLLTDFNSKRRSE